MERKTRTLFSDFQIKRMKAFLEEASDAANILCGASQMGLDVPEVEVLASDLLWNDPNQRDPAVRLYVPIHLESGTTGFEARAVTMGKGMRRDRLVSLSLPPSKINVRGVTNCETLSPADTAIELTEEEAWHLERARPLFGHWMHYLRNYLRSLTGEGLRFPWPGVMSGEFASEEPSTLCMVSNEVNDLAVIREDGTVPPVGRSIEEPHEHDGEREETIRPRIEELRA